MKALITTDTHGGVWNHTLDLARGLAEHDVDTVLAVMGGSPSTRMKQEAEQIPGLALEIRGFRLEWMHEPWGDVDDAGAWLQELESFHDVDVVHSNSYAHGAAGFRAPVLVAGHSCLLSWWEAIHGIAPPPPEWVPYRNRVRAGLESARAVAAPTRWMLERLEHHYGPLSKPRVPIPNGRTPFATPAPDKEDHVLWVGRAWDPAKNVHLLDEAAARLELDVRVVGDLEHPETQEPVELDHVEPAGRIPTDRLKEAYARAGVFVSTAQYEPFGLGPLEAAQAGCALVLPRIESLEQTWHDAALYYPPGDVDGLTRRIEQMTHDTESRTAHATKARERAREYTHTRMAGCYLDLYRRLIRAHPKNRHQAPHRTGEVAARAS